MTWQRQVLASSTSVHVEAHGLRHDRAPSIIAGHGNQLQQIHRLCEMAMNDVETVEPLVLIVDDDEQVRNSLQELMHSVDIEVAAFATTRELLESGLPDRPGCLILDVRMPGASGLDLQDHFAQQGTAKPIVFLTAFGDIPMTVKAMKAGALDFLTKPVRDQTLLDAVMTGIQRDIAQRAQARAVRKQIERFETLTSRERQVLRSVVFGRLNKQIAFDLGISEVTVKLHRGNGMRKMRVASVSQLTSAWELLPEPLQG